MRKRTYPKLRFFKFRKFVSKSVFWELQLKHILVNFKISCYFLSNLKIRAKLCATFLLF